MQNPVLLKIEDMEGVLTHKVKALKESVEEDQKQLEIKNAKIKLFRDELYLIVSRAVATVDQSLTRLLDPLDTIQPTIQDLGGRLMDLKKYWKRVRIFTPIEKNQVLEELAQIRSRIQSLQPKKKAHFNINDAFSFDPDKIEQSILNAIQLQEDDNTERKDLLLTRFGKFDLETGKHHKINFYKDIPMWAAFLQHNNKLFVCGGLEDDERTCLADFFWADSVGRCQELASMTEL